MLSMGDERIVLKTKDLSKRYPSLKRKDMFAVKDLSIEINKGEVFGFLGRNGAGKTTTIKMICGLLIPTSGGIWINGIEWKNPYSRRSLGYLPEQPYFYEYLTPKETVKFYCQLKGMNKRECEREWGRLSEMLDLKDISDIRIRNFSKGMRQKIGFAIALVGNPELLVLDEPMSGLDPIGRKHIRELIISLKNSGKTIFFSSHVLSDVEQLCDRVGVLTRGRLVAEGSIKEVLHQEIRSVDVVLRYLEEWLINEFSASAQLVHRWEDYVCFKFDSSEIANLMVKKALENSAKLVEFVPQKESLEEFFVRMQITEEEESKRGKLYYSKLEE
ncbi:MAG: ABC transporter ATP-binding protein [Candidatus Hydrogenedentes bacterium]|nr:ABC transporter ATP-binding protein [Candidatus Hydrogenedentota bacterium]